MSTFPSNVNHMGDPIKVLATVDLYVQAQKSLDAIRLVELGARTTLVRKLTGLEKKVVKRLYRQLMGKPSTAGQMPFSDAWYLKDPRRMLHASLVWRLFESASKSSRTPARIMIDVYTGYLNLVDEPLLCITRAFFVSHLMAMDVWYERICIHCGVPYLTQIANIEAICPGCTIYYRHRCRQCGIAMEVSTQGRYRKSCDACKTRGNNHG